MQITRVIYFGSISMQLDYSRVVPAVHHILYFSSLLILRKTKIRLHYAVELRISSKTYVDPIMFYAYMDGKSFNVLQ